MVNRKNRVNFIRIRSCSIGNNRIHAQLSTNCDTQTHLDVTAAAVNVLLVLDGELDDHRLLLVGEGLELPAEGVEARVLARLDALVLVGVAVELASGPHELAGLGVGLVGGLHPVLLPVLCNGV